MSRKKKKKDLDAVHCTTCYDCKWVIEEDKTPFYDLNFSSLRIGDELIRCWQCNSVKMPKPAKQKLVSGSATKHKFH